MEHKKIVGIEKEYLTIYTLSPYQTLI